MKALGVRCKHCGGSVNRTDGYDVCDSCRFSRDLVRARHQSIKNRKANRLTDEAVCVYCGGQATEYDHVVPIAKGGTNDDANIVRCCHHCNLMKSIKTVPFQIRFKTMPKKPKRVPIFRIWGKDQRHIVRYKPPTPLDEYRLKRSD